MDFLVNSSPFAGKDKTSKFLTSSHTGSIDLKMIEDRMKDNDLISTGRLKHIQKRAKTIFVISQAKKIRQWDGTVGKVRWVQQHIRPVNAWNKPWNPVSKVVVRIPDRFVGLL